MALVDALVVGAVFGSAAFLGPVLSRRLSEAAAVSDLPKRYFGGTLGLTTIAAGTGILLASRTATPIGLLVTAVVLTALSAAWHATRTYDAIPLPIIVTPLVLLLGIAIFGARYGIVLAALGLCAPFVLSLFVYAGRGIRRDDALLAALGGAMFGFGPGIVIFAIASIVYAIAGRMLPRPRVIAPLGEVTPAAPTAVRPFTPYVVFAMAFGVLVGAAFSL